MRLILNLSTTNPTHMKGCLFLLLLATTSGLHAAKTDPAAEYVSALKRVTDIMVNDVTSPVASARYYAYTTLASYESLSAFQPAQYPSLVGSLTHPLRLELSEGQEKDLQACSRLALWKAAAALLPSGTKLKPGIDSLSTHVSPAGLELIDKVVNQIVAWALRDGFLQLNNLQRYTPKRGPAFWQPTGPAFMAPIEPHWNTIRTLVLDSADQFVPLPPAPFDLDKDSPFYALLQEVYESVRSKNPEKEAIANFWDCNPYHISQIGHVEFGTKKISPGGHWMGIAGIACKKAKLPLGHTVLAHTLVAVTLHDAFIACWDEKYRSHRVRPETAIRAFVDKTWKTVLQTPPFPEYVSGHSVASTAASVVLTRIFGPEFSFSDDTEVEFGLPVRKFRSFASAADEASLSRLYGGIHFRDAIEQGVWQGKEVGQLVSARLKAHFDYLAKR